MRMILGAVGLALALSACAGDPDPQTADAPQSEWEKQQSGESDSETKWGDGSGATPTLEPAEMREPTLDDFKLTVKVKEKQCFGSAGCNLTVEVQPGIADLSLMTDRSVELTYELRGIEDGPLIGTFDIDAEGNYSVEQEYVSTATSNAKLKAVPTDLTVR